MADPAAVSAPLPGTPPDAHEVKLAGVLLDVRRRFRNPEPAASDFLIDRALSAYISLPSLLARIEQLERRLTRVVTEAEAAHRFLGNVEWNDTATDLEAAELRARLWEATAPCRALLGKPSLSVGSDTPKENV